MTMGTVRPGDTFTLDVEPRMGWLRRQMVRLGVAKRPAKVRRTFTVQAALREGYYAEAMMATTCPPIPLAVREAARTRLAYQQSLFVEIPGLGRLYTGTIDYGDIIKAEGYCVVCAGWDRWGYRVEKRGASA